MTLPTTGYTPDAMLYRLHDQTMLVDVVTVDVWPGNETWMPRAQVAGIVHTHMQAMYAALMAAATRTDIGLHVEYRGVRTDDLAPGGGA